MLKKIIKKIYTKAVNMMSKKTKKHIVVFESDDWGAIRVPNKETLDEFKQKFPNLNLNNYQLLDSLETEEDLNNLSNTLTSVKDKNGKPACFTINFVTENPNFKQIKENNFTKFVGEKVTETYNFYETNSSNIINKFLTGEKNGVFDIQLHAKEHINSAMWLKNASTIDYCKWAFEHNMVGVDYGKYNNLDVFNATNTNINIEEYISQACENFTQIFNKKPQSFIASCYIQNKKVENALNEEGIKFIQSTIKPNVSRKNGKLSFKLVYLGQKNKNGQIFTTRNVMFETSKDYLANKTPKQAAVNTLNDISKIFEQHLPAIICTHRVNFVSRIDPNNAKFGNKALSILLKMLTEKYPDIEFLSSYEFASRLSKGKKNGNY